MALSKPEQPALLVHRPEVEVGDEERAGAHARHEIRDVLFDSILAEQIPWIRFSKGESVYNLRDAPEAVIRQRISALNTQVGADSTQKIFGLWMAGRPLSHNARFCPGAMQVIERIGPVHAGFSCLEPGAAIQPQRGGDRNINKCHLGLLIPEGDCALRAGGVARKWREGDYFIFDDQSTHEAWNCTAERRFIMIFDLRKPPRAD